MTDCHVCARKGILIYPVRYAIACPAGAAGVPGLSGNFKIENAPTDLGTVKYTLRSMRAGYMYAYDEKRKKLRAYMVMPEGTLWNFPTEFLPPSPGSVTSSCTNQGEFTFMRCVDIIHAKGDTATNLWIGWSSVVWTKNLIAKVGDAAWRKKHMQCIDIAAMVAGKAKHTAKFFKHHKEIAHFGVDKEALLKAFAFSNTTTEHEGKQRILGDIITETMAAHAPYNKGFIVALNDPVGITNDLSELTLPTIDAGFDEDVARGRMVFDMLASAEQSIREDARNRVLTSDRMAEMAKDNPDGDTYNSAKVVWKIIKAGGLGNYEKNQAADRKKYGEKIEGRQQAAADHAWEDLSTEEKSGKRIPFLDIKRFNEFPQTYTNAIREFQPVNELLARIHVAWLTSQQLADWMEGVHDANDIRSGYAFSESLSQCICKAVANEACAAQLFTWLNKGNLSDHRNLYARALLFNQDELANATEPSLKGSDIQIENILNLYKLTLLKIEKGHAAKLKDRLAFATANILIKALQGSAYSVMQGLAKLHLTLVGQARITTYTSSPAELGAWVFEQAKAKGIRFNESDTRSRNAAHRHAERTVRDTTLKSGVIAYEIDMAQLHREGIISEHTIRKVKVPGFDLTEKWLGSSSPREFHLGVVTIILQLLALRFAAKDIANEDQFNSLERNTKGVCALIGLASTIVDMAATTVRKAPSHPLAAFLPVQWAVDAERAKLVARGAQFIGCVAGIATGLYDIFLNGLPAWVDGNRTVGFLYGINGSLGILVALAGFFSWAIFWPLLVLSFIVGIVIAVISSSALKDWMSRCYFSMAVTRIRAATHGVAPFKPYPYITAIDECKSFNKSIEA